eukprot:31117-Pelagococcus_subviridis.AAC.20
MSCIVYRVISSPATYTIGAAEIFALPARPRAKKPLDASPPRARGAAQLSRRPPFARSRRRPLISRGGGVWRSESSRGRGEKIGGASGVVVTRESRDVASRSARGARDRVWRSRRFGIVPFRFFDASLRNGS